MFTLCLVLIVEPQLPVRLLVKGNVLFGFAGCPQVCCIEPILVLVVVDYLNASSSLIACSPV